MKWICCIILLLTLACKKEVEPLPAESRLYIPNSFTPDNDGLNDEFVITPDSYSQITAYEIRIWNDRQIAVFTSTAFTHSWNGRDHNTGFSCKLGSYSYFIRTTVQSGATYTRNGTLMLLR